MARPKKNRMVQHPPVFTTFKPTGIPARHLKEIPLSLDQYEAIRLTDLLGYDHETAAKHMHISRSTFTRLIEQARNVIAEFIVQGGNLVIGGGIVHFKTNRIYCKKCRKAFAVPIGKTVSVCPECGSENIEDLALLMGHGLCCLPDEEDRDPSSH